MSSLENALKQLIKENYGGVPKFAEQIGVPPTSVYSALERGMRNTRTELTDKIYRELNVDWETAKLDGFHGLKVKKAIPGNYVDIPLYGSIAAGTPFEMIQIDGTHPIPKKVADQYPQAFLLKVKGESMNRILPNGCYALVDPCEEADRPGQPYAVCVNGNDATVKRVKPLNNGFELAPDSTDPTFKPTTYDYGIEGTETITLIGRVVYYVLPFDWDF